MLCSYVTLPLYALVTQMGSSMKATIFNDRVATALKNWHHTAKKNVKESRHSESGTPFSSRPATPTHGMSPVHLLHKHPFRSGGEAYHDEEHMHMHMHDASPSSYHDVDHWDLEASPSPSRHRPPLDLPSAAVPASATLEDRHDSPKHEITIALSDFSFDKRHNADRD